MGSLHRMLRRNRTCHALVMLNILTGDCALAQAVYIRLERHLRRVGLRSRQGRVRSAASRVLQSHLSRIHYVPGVPVNLVRFISGSCGPSTHAPHLFSGIVVTLIDIWILASIFGAIPHKNWSELGIVSMGNMFLEPR